MVICIYADATVIKSHNEICAIASQNNATYEIVALRAKYYKYFQLKMLVELYLFIKF